MLSRWLTLLIITHPPHFIRFVRIAREDPLQNYHNKRQKWCLVVDSKWHNPVCCLAFGHSEDHEINLYTFYQAP